MTTPETTTTIETDGTRKHARDIRMPVGRTVHQPQKGAWYTVTASRMHRPDVDGGHYDWTESATLRPATETEIEATQTARVARGLARIA